MERYRVLVVDNDEQLLERASRLERHIEGVVIRTAKDLASARAIIQSEFLHCAFVDLQLDTHPAPVPQGMAVLRDLHDLRPACRRFLLTEYVTENRDEVFALLDPRSQIIESVVDKAAINVTLRSVIESLNDAWRDNLVSVESLDSLTAAVQAKCGGARTRSVAATPRPEITPEEVDYVISRLLGQGRYRIKRDVANGRRRETVGRDAIASIDLTPRTKGRSRSVVASGRPTSQSGHRGVYCVIKLSERQEALEERDRYERYVRLGVSSDRRVELVGSAMGDRIGGLCYTFAGRSPDQVTDVEDLLDSESERVLLAFEALFQGESLDWYRSEEQEAGTELTTFFADAYGLSLSQVLRDQRRFVEGNATAWGAVFRRDALYFGKDFSERIALPAEHDFTHGRVRDDYLSTIVHGDLNSANVMLSEDGRVLLIDFRHTTRGPRLLDVAALQSSIRMSRCCDSTSSEAILESHRLEEQLLSQLAKGSFERVPGGVDALPYWAQMSWGLLTLVRESRAGFTVDEYASTALLYLIRVLRVAQLQDAVRLRLLVWGSSLIDHLRRSDKRRS